MWGVAMKFGSCRRGFPALTGSSSKTSAAAAASCPLARAAASAASSTIPPRAALTRRLPGFIWASWRGPIRPRVFSVSGAWTVMKSARPRSSSRPTSSTLNCSARSCGTTGSKAITSISNPCARLATSVPMLPRPTMPSVFPRISTPVKRARCHSPRRTEASACGIQRATASSSPIVCSAAAVMLPRGAFTTRMPRRVAASISMLSTPTPARPTTRSRRPASKTFSPTLVALRTTRASKAGMASTSWASVSPVRTSTSPAWRSLRRPSSARLSATRMAGIRDSTALGVRPKKDPRLDFEARPAIWRPGGRSGCRLTGIHDSTMLAHESTDSLAAPPPTARLARIATWLGPPFRPHP